MDCLSGVLTLVWCLVLQCVSAWVYLSFFWLSRPAPQQWISTYGGGRKGWQWVGSLGSKLRMWEGSKGRWASYLFFWLKCPTPEQRISTRGRGRGGAGGWVFEIQTKGLESPKVVGPLTCPSDFILLLSSWKHLDSQARWETEQDLGPCLQLGSQKEKPSLNRELDLSRVHHLHMKKDPPQVFNLYFPTFSTYLLLQNTPLIPP